MGSSGAATTLARMRRGPNRQDRPPRVGARVLAKALVGVFVILLCSGAASAAAGYFQFRTIDPSAGAAETPTGSPKRSAAGRARRSAHAARARLRPPRQARDRRQARPEPHSDTIVLIRLDPKRERVAVLSLPRDLAVTIPGYADGVKINQAYDEGGAGLTLKTVKQLFESATGEKFRSTASSTSTSTASSGRSTTSTASTSTSTATTTTPNSGSRRSTSRPATSGSSARTRSPTSATATPTPTSSATRASRTSCARRPTSGRCRTPAASATPRSRAGLPQYFRFDRNS